MIIYNVTSNIDDSIHDDWIIWIKPHIQQVLETGCFIEAKFSRVVVEESMGGITYSVQYRAKSRTDLERYYSEFADSLRSETYLKFGEKVLSFRTELEEIENFSISS